MGRTRYAHVNVVDAYILDLGRPPHELLLDPLLLPGRRKEAVLNDFT